MKLAKSIPYFIIFLSSLYNLNFSAYESSSAYSSDIGFYYSSSSIGSSKGFSNTHFGCDNCYSLILSGFRFILFKSSTSIFYLLSQPSSFYFLYSYKYHGVHFHTFILCYYGSYTIGSIGSPFFHIILRSLVISHIGL